MAGTDVTTLVSALNSSFGEDSVNTDLVKFYTTSGYKRVNASLSGGKSEDYRINEVPWDKYTDSLKSTFASYGDVALVVLARSGGEGSDLPSGIPSISECNFRYYTRQISSPLFHPELISKQIAMRSRL